MAQLQNDEFRRTSLESLDSSEATTLPIYPFEHVIWLPRNGFRIFSMAFIHLTCQRGPMKIQGKFDDGVFLASAALVGFL